MSIHSVQFVEEIEQYLHLKLQIPQFKVFFSKNPTPQKQFYEISLCVGKMHEVQLDFYISQFEQF